MSNTKHPNIPSPENPGAVDGWKRVKAPLQGVACFTKKVSDGKLTVLLSVDSGLVHLSISHPKRYPHWDEIREARYDFCPKNRTMAMLLPPKNEYVNVHENTFHLWEIQDMELPL